MAQVGRQNNRQLAQHAFGCEGLRVQLQLAGFDLGKIQNIVEQAQHGLGRTLGLADVIELALVEFGGVHQLQHAQNGIHGGADFVAHIGQELAFAEGRLFGNVARFLQVLFMLHALGDVAVAKNPANGAFAVACRM